MQTLINIRALTTALPFASSDRTRVYLTGVHVCRPLNGTYPDYAATDGHVLCSPFPSHGELENILEKHSLTVTPLPEEGVSIPPEVVKMVAGWLVKKERETEWLVLTDVAGAPGQYEVKTLDGAKGAKFKAVDGTYPDWRRVVPAIKQGRTDVADRLGFNAAYLAMLKPVAQNFAHPKTLSLAMHAGGFSDPVRFEFKNPDGEAATVIIMPMRV